VPRRSVRKGPTSVPGVWHPVGALPARVYWRRRLVLLTVLLAVLGGGTWLGIALLGQGDAGAAAEASESARPSRLPELDRVVPSLARVATPSPPEVPLAAEAAQETAATATGPRAGDRCTDDMVEVTVRAPRTAAVGSKPTFELVVTNVSADPCVRALDKELQEMQLHDAGGNRVWGSNDCFPEASDDARTLAPRQAVRIPLVWGGLTSQAGCAGERVPPAPGAYLLRARLDTEVSPPARLTLG
jgi:hypothetical protein